MFSTSLFLSVGLYVFLSVCLSVFLSWFAQCEYPPFRPSVEVSRGCFQQRLVVLGQHIQGHQKRHVAGVIHRRYSPPFHPPPPPHFLSYHYSLLSSHLAIVVLLMSYHPLITIKHRCPSLSSRHVALLSILLFLHDIPALCNLNIYQLSKSLTGASSAATVSAGAGSASTSSAATDALGGDHKDKGMGMDADDREADDAYGLSAILDVFNTAGGD